MAATVIPTISPAQFAQRLAANFPNSWASPDAAQRGNLYALFLSLGQQIQAVLEQVRYADNAVYVPTETSPELDLAGMDFYGGTLPRPAGATDAGYAALILSGLFQPAATRGALTAAIERLTGYTPRMIEPWNPADTGVWDSGVSYWDVDNAATPFLWTGEEAATGFIKSAAPLSSGNTNLNQLYGWDTYLYWDVATSAFYDTILNPTLALVTLINKLRAFGVTIGLRVVNPLELTYGLPPLSGWTILPSGLGLYGQATYGSAVYG